MDICTFFISYIREKQRQKNLFFLFETFSLLRRPRRRHFSQTRNSRRKSLQRSFSLFFEGFLLHSGNFTVCAYTHIHPALHCTHTHTHVHFYIHNNMPHKGPKERRLHPDTKSNCWRIIVSYTVLVFGFVILFRTMSREVQD